MLAPDQETIRMSNLLFKEDEEVPDTDDYIGNEISSDANDDYPVICYTSRLRQLMRLTMDSYIYRMENCLTSFTIRGKNVKY